MEFKKDYVLSRGRIVQVTVKGDQIDIDGKNIIEYTRFLTDKVDSVTSVGKTGDNYLIEAGSSSYIIYTEDNEFHLSRWVDDHYVKIYTV